MPTHAGVKGADAYAFATSATQRNGAVFLTLHNHSDTDVHVISADSDVAARAELHTHGHHGGIMQMRPVEHFEILHEQSLTLAPMGDHIMLMGLYKPLVVGEDFEMTLSFDHQDPIIVDVHVVPPGQIPTGMGKGL